MNKNEFSILKVSASEWQEVIKWEKSEQWELGLGDEDLFINTDPNGFFMGYYNRTPVSSISIVNFSYSYSHLGHVLVAPDKRGLGFGLETFKHTIKYNLANTSGLDSVVNKRKNYEKWGYIVDYRIYRLSGIIPPLFQKYNLGTEIINSVNIAEVIDFDAFCIGYRRDNLLKNWFTGKGRWGFIVRSNGQISGLIGARRSTTGIRIGPIYASDTIVLKQLIKSLYSIFSQDVRITVDIPEYAHDAITLFNDAGLFEQFYTYRMYRGDVPNAKSYLIKAVASLDLG